MASPEDEKKGSQACWAAGSAAVRRRLRPSMRRPRSPTVKLSWLSSRRPSPRLL